MKNTKTFWSVTYNGFGFTKPKIAWFDNKSGAVKFASGNYRDNPIRHTVSKLETIDKYNRLVEMTIFELYEL